MAGPGLAGAGRVCSFPQVGHVQGTVAAGLEEKKLVMPDKMPPEGAGAGAGAPAEGAPVEGALAEGPLAEGAAGTLLAEDMFLRMKIFGMNQ